MKERSAGKAGKTSSQTSPQKAMTAKTTSPPNGGEQDRKTDRSSSEIPGLTKKSKSDLIAMAHSMGLSVDTSDRRLDLIEKIKKGPTTKPATKNAKTSLRKKKETTFSPSPANTLDEAPLSAIQNPAPLPVAPPPPVTSSFRAAEGWKDFLDIPYEPVRRERGHRVTILPVSPFRIVAFFSMDRAVDPDLNRRVDEAGLVLKIRDITSAFLQGPLRDDLPTDHVFDIMAGFAERWSIPLWSSNRLIEAWLGFYDKGTFRILARSKRIGTPRGAPSPRVGTIFHLRENLREGFLTMEDHWKDSWSLSQIKLSTSHNLPSSHYRP